MIEKAITELYNDKMFHSICKRYGKSDSEDLKQIVILILLEKPKNILEHIISSGYLMPYALQVTRLQVSKFKTNKWSVFNKNFGGIVEPLHEGIEAKIIDIPYTEDHFILSDKVSKKILDDALNQDNPHFYHAMLVKLKVEHKNVKKISKATKIPYRSLLHAIDEYKKYLNEWAQES